MCHRRVLLATLALALALPLGASAEEQKAVPADPRKAEKYRPTGSVTVDAKSMSLGLEVSWGKGTLTFQGEEYPFKVGGLGLVGIGASSLVATGEVFNLDKLEDFNGTWGQVSGSAVIGVGSSGGITLRNGGVYMTLGASMKGAQLTVGGGALKVELLDVAAE